MVRIYGSPHRYFQGVGAFDLLGEVCAPLSRHPAIVIDADVNALVARRLGTAMGDLPYTALPFRGEITVPVIQVLTSQAQAASADLIVGIGGGKALDAGKGVARRLNAPFVSVPTVASNDSPTAMALAVYDDNHTLSAIEHLRRNPEAVIVDTGLIAQAPLRFLRAGIGDAVAKKFEVERAAVDGAQNFFNTRPLHTAAAIADGCYRLLRNHGRAAMQAAEAHTVTDALEAVVEANILMAGLGYENGGLSMAHAIVRGLVKARGASARAHGEHVAYALLVQLAIEERGDAFIEDLRGFYREVGLPVSLAALDMPEPTAAEIADIARLTLSGPKGGRLIVPVGPEVIVRAINRIEAS